MGVTHRKETHVHVLEDTAFDKQSKKGKHGVIFIIFRCIVQLEKQGLWQALPISSADFIQDLSEALDVQICIACKLPREECAVQVVVMIAVFAAAPAMNDRSSELIKY